jgi:cytochrome c553
MRRPVAGNASRAIAALALALLGVEDARAEKDWNAPRVVTWECSGCHGIDGNSESPIFPRLAGLSADYIKAQIAAYQKSPRPFVIEMPQPVLEALPEWLVGRQTPEPGARTSPEARTNMIGMAHSVTPAEVDEAAAWFSTQRPGPGSQPWEWDRDWVRRGQEIFEAGLPEQGIPACQDCHGPQGEGIAEFPRLAGQHAPYVVRQWRAFRDGSRTHGGPMETIAKDLTREEIRAIALYVQSL